MLELDRIWLKNYIPSQNTQPTIPSLESGPRFSVASQPQFYILVLLLHLRSYEIKGKEKKIKVEVGGGMQQDLLAQKAPSFQRVKPQKISFSLSSLSSLSTTTQPRL